MAAVAYQHVHELVPKPEVAFSPPIDKMIVNFETWLGDHADRSDHRDRGDPGALGNRHRTGDRHRMAHRIAGRRRHHLITCQPWGSTEFAKDGCSWTPTYPSVGKVTGTTDLRYHGTVTIVWQVTWQATNGASGTLGDLRTTTPVEMGVQEIQTIGG